MLSTTTSSIHHMPLQDRTMDSSHTTLLQHSPPSSRSSSSSPVWCLPPLVALELLFTLLFRTRLHQEVVSMAPCVPHRAPPRPSSCPPRWVHPCISTVPLSLPPPQPCLQGTARRLLVNRCQRLTVKEAQVSDLS